MEKRGKYKVLLVEPSEIIAGGLKEILRRSADFEVVNAISSPGYYSAQQGDVDIIIVNPSVVNYDERMDVRSVFAGERERLTFVALTYTNFDENVLRQYDGSIGIYDSASRIAQKLHSAMEEAELSPKSDLNELSTRERDILISVAKGCTNKEIADEFKISVYTVISHRRNISRKLGINSIPGLTVYAIMNKLVDLSELG